ncbi:MAG: hypothetical protein ACRC11_04880 [Xenococcaceae cyanobacterium]
MGIGQRATGNGHWALGKVTHSKVKSNLLLATYYLLLTTIPYSLK